MGWGNHLAIRNHWVTSGCSAAREVADRGGPPPSRLGVGRSDPHGNFFAVWFGFLTWTVRVVDIGVGERSRAPWGRGGDG